MDFSDINLEALLPKLIDYGLKLLGAIILLIVGYFLAHWGGKQVKNRTEKKLKLDGTLSLVFAKMVRITIFAITVIMVLNQFGVTTTTLVALLGAAGLAVGLALQGALSNVAAGVVLLSLRPFKVGDFIECGSLMGIVDEIGLFVTRMHTVDNIAMSVPNSQLWGSEIKNYTTNDTRRMDMVFSISYSDDMDKAMQIVKQVIEEDDRFLKDPEPLVAVAELGDSSVNIFARPWVKRTDFWFAKLDFTKKVKQRFDAAGITIPFPQRDVHLFQESRPAAA